MNKINIYFSGSVSGGRDDQKIYEEILPYLKQYGNVLTEYICDPNFIGDVQMKPEGVYERDMNWLKNANVLVAEITTPSLGVGYEINFAEERKIPVLCIYRPIKRISPIIVGNPNLKCAPYNSVKNLEPILDNFFKFIKR